jgi:Immunoglobulin-like domain of bacterial spore germination
MVRMGNYLKLFSFAILGIALVYGFLVFDFGRGPKVVDFITCAAAENQILESYPRQCRDGEGFIFVEALATTSVSELIIVDTPTTTSTVSDSFLATGKARGQWFFEGSFPVKVIGANGDVLGSGIAKAQGDWMSIGFVPFTASIDFKSRGNAEGIVRFVKDNPSGTPALDAHLDVPVRFELKK